MSTPSTDQTTPLAHRICYFWRYYGAHPLMLVHQDRKRLQVLGPSARTSFFRRGIVSASHRARYKSISRRVTFWICSASPHSDRVDGRSRTNEKGGGIELRRGSRDTAISCVVKRGIPPGSRPLGQAGVRQRYLDAFIIGTGGTGRDGGASA